MSARAAFRSVLVLVPLLAAGVVVYVRAVGTQVSQAVTAPRATHWVPFTANITRVDPTGRKWVGRFYRSSDGSTRSETGPSLDNITSIGIKNIGRVKFYLWGKSTGWTEQPMELPPAGWYPPVVPADAFQPTTLRIETFDLLKRESGGTILYVASVLDHFTVAYLPKKCGDADANCGTRFSNIAIREPDVTLFEPSPGEPVRMKAEFGGIYRMKPPPPGQPPAEFRLEIPH